MRKSLPLIKLKSKPSPPDKPKDEQKKDEKKEAEMRAVEKREVVVEAGRIADMELDTECILERSRLVSVAPARMPYISFFGRYNKRWYVDIVTLPHNSVRAFLSQVFALVTAIHRLALDLTQADFEKVFFILDEFARYTKVILEAEEKLLYPEVEGNLRKIVKENSNHPLSPKNRAETKHKMFKLLAGLIKEEMKVRENVALVTSLQAIVDDLSRQLMDYFSAKESTLPLLVAKFIRGSKEKTRMESRLIKHFASLNQEYHYAAFLTLPLQNEQVRVDFEERHFSKATRAYYRFAVDNVNSSLKGIPSAFEEAARKYEGRFSMSAFLQNYGKDREADATTKVV